MVSRGQGALEYLLIIGGGILVAIVIISQVLSLASPCSSEGSQRLIISQTCSTFTTESLCTNASFANVTVPGVETACQWNAGAQIGKKCFLNSNAQFQCSTAAPPACTPECNAGQLRCGGAGNNFSQSCGEFDSVDACLEWDPAGTDCGVPGCNTGIGLCNSPALNSCTFTVPSTAILVDDGTKTFTVTSNGEVPSGIISADSSCGSSATTDDPLFTPPSTADCGPYSTRGLKTISLSLDFPTSDETCSPTGNPAEDSFCVNPCSNGQSRCLPSGGINRESCSTDLDTCLNWSGANCPQSTDACVGAGVCIPEYYLNTACQITGPSVINQNQNQNWTVEFSPGVTQNVTQGSLNCDGVINPTDAPTCDYSANYNCQFLCPGLASEGHQWVTGDLEYPPEVYGVQCTKEYCISTCSLSATRCSGNTVEVCVADSVPEFAGCNNYQFDHACTGGQTCQNGACADPTAPTCTISVNPSSIASGPSASTSVTITPQNFLNNTPAFETATRSCGAAGTTFTMTPNPPLGCPHNDSIPNLPCTGTCGPYPTASASPYSITATLRHGFAGPLVVCTPATMQVKSCALTPSAQFIDLGTGSTNISFGFTGFSNAPSVQSFTCDGGTATPASPVCTAGPSACANVACNNYASLGTKVISFTAKDGTAPAEPAVSCTANVTVVPEGGGQLIGHWTFDNKVGSQYINEYSGGPNLDIRGSGAALREIPFNSLKSVYFEGLSNGGQYLAVASAVDLRNSDYSVSMWVNVGQGIGARPLMSMCLGGGPNQCYFVRYQHWGGVQFAIEGQTESPAGPPAPGTVISPVNNIVTPGKWQHIVWTYDKDTGGGTFKLYLDNVLRQTYTGINPINTSTASPNLCIGAWCDNGITGLQHVLDGKIKDVWIFKGTLTTTGVNQLFTYLSPPTFTNFSPNPVASWFFEDPGNPSTYADSSGNALTLARRETATQVAGRIGSGISFDGVPSGDYKALEGDFIPLSNGAFSVTMWVKPSTTNFRWGDLFSLCENINQSNKCLHINSHNDSANINFRLWGDDLDASGMFLMPGRWNHVAITMSATRYMRLYVNGINVAGRAANQFLTLNFGNVCIGKRCRDAGEYYPGIIDQVRVYKRELDPFSGEVLSLYNAEGGAHINGDGSGNSCWEVANIYGYGNLRMIHRANNNFNDVLGNFNGTTGGTGNNVTASTAGCLNQAYTFDGDRDYVRIANNLQIRGNSEFTIRAWVKTTQTTEGTILERFAGNAGGGRHRVAIVVNSGSIDGKAAFVMEDDAGGPCVLKSTAVINDGAWHHIAVARSLNSGIYKLVVDGAEIEATPFGTCTNWVNDAAETVIGAGKSAYDASAPDTRFFNGQIDDVAVWERYLSRTETQLLR